MEQKWEGDWRGKPLSEATLFCVLGIVLFDILKNGVGSEEEKIVSHLPKGMLIQVTYLSTLGERRLREGCHT